MALQNSDLFLVQDATTKTNYKVTFQNLANDLGSTGAVDSVNGETGTVVLDAADVGAATTAQGALADSALQPGEAATTAQGALADSALQPGDAATTAQGTKADTAVQPGDDISDLNNDAGFITDAGVVKITAGTGISLSPANGEGTVEITATGSGGSGGAVDSVNGETGTVVLDAADVGAATTAQGALADSALQPGDAATTTQGALADSALQPGDAATTAQGALADSALQPGDAATTAQGALADSALQPGDAATTSQGAKADSATQPGDNVSTLNNDAGYITASDVPAAPVTSVNGDTGVVVLDAADVGAATTAQGALADSALQAADIGTTVQGYDSDTAKTDVVQTFTAAQRGAIATLTDNTTITPNFSTSNNFTVTLGGNRTFANPTNLNPGQTGSIFIVQNGAGNHSAAWGSYWDFAAATAPTLTTAGGSVDRVDYIVRTTTSIHAVFTGDYQ